jgi:hypothetical protein
MIIRQIDDYDIGEQITYRLYSITKEEMKKEYGILWMKYELSLLLTNNNIERVFDNKLQDYAYRIIYMLIIWIGAFKGYKETKIILESNIPRDINILNNEEIKHDCVGYIKEGDIIWNNNEVGYLQYLKKQIINYKFRQINMEMDKIEKDIKKYERYYIREKTYKKILNILFKNNTDVINKLLHEYIL